MSEGYQWKANEKFSSVGKRKKKFPASAHAADFLLAQSSHFNLEKGKPERWTAPKGEQSLNARANVEGQKS